MSVYQLINKLCVELIKEDECDEIKLQSARKIAFEILLKKSFNESLLHEKTVKDYQFASFELALHNKTKELEKLDSFTDELRENPESLLPISAFLILLKNIDSEEVCEVSLVIYSHFACLNTVYFYFYSIIASFSYKPKHSRM